MDGFFIACLKAPDDARFCDDSPRPRLYGPPRTSSGPPDRRQELTPVAPTEPWSERRARWLNRFHARRAGIGPVASGFVSTPEPRSMGSFHRGRQIAAGNFLFAGFLVEAPETPIWDLPMPDPVFEAEVHGFAWLDDLAAVGDRAAQNRAQAWTHDWISRYGAGTGRAGRPTSPGGGWCAGSTTPSSS
jgi:hypothetical protein